MRVKKVSIYIRLCGEPGRPFKRLKVRNPRQCGERDCYCLRVAGKFEFFAEHDPAHKDLNEALHPRVRVSASTNSASVWLHRSCRNGR